MNIKEETKTKIKTKKVYLNIEEKIKLKYNLLVNLGFILVLFSIFLNIIFYDIQNYLFLFTLGGGLFIIPILYLLPISNILLLRLFSLIYGLILLLSSVYLMIILMNYDFFAISLKWWSYTIGGNINLMFDHFNIVMTPLSLLFIILTNFLIVVCLLISWNWLPFFYSMRLFIALLFLIQFFCVNFFVSSHLIGFYIFFESVLIPMYFLIGIWGLRDRKIHASYQFFLFTFFGSLFMLVATILLGAILKTYDLNYLTINWWMLSTIQSKWLILIIWFGFFLGFAIKVPMVPFHIWLPEAHVEAPTSGSIILAGVLLKFGTFGFYKVLISILPSATNYFFKYVLCLSLMGIFYASIVNYAQIDLKKIIAYSSISHMGYITLGLVLDTMEGISGALLMMITHGVISGGLFYIVGILYERYGTRNIYYYGGLKSILPGFVFFFFFLTLANMNLPLTAGFVPEFLVLIATGGLESKIISLLAAFGLVTNGIYCIWLFNRLCMGQNINLNNTIEHKDLDKRETLILILFSIIIVLLGIFPNSLLALIEESVFQILWSRNIYMHFFILA